MDQLGAEVMFPNNYCPFAYTNPISHYRTLVRFPMPVVYMEYTLETMAGMVNNIIVSIT